MIALIRGQFATTISISFKRLFYSWQSLASFSAATPVIPKIYAKMIQKQLGKDVADVHDIAKSSKEDLEGYDILLLGIPTWYYGEAQCDWDDFFPTLEEIDFNGKLVALFGCGDQEDYAEYFCDALGTIRDIIEPRGATIVGHWPTAGYHFEASKGLADDDHFVGLAIDEDRQPELTAERVEKWVKQVSAELHLDDILNA